MTEQSPEVDEHLDQPAPPEANPDARSFAVPVAEFEGEFVRKMEGKLPALTLEMPEGYKRGTHLLLNVEVRVRDVNYHETSGREKDLMRQHTFALEEVQLVDAFDPAMRPNNVGGNSAGDAWLDTLGDWLEGRTDVLNFDDDEIPERLQKVLEIFAEHTGQTEAPEDPEDEEVFCPDCRAGMDSSEHHEKCEIPEAELEAARASVVSAGF